MWVLVREDILNLSYPAWGYLLFGGLQFNAGDHINLPLSASCRGCTQFGVSIWFKPEILNGNARTLYSERETFGQSRILLVINTDNQLLWGGRAPDGVGFTTWVDSTAVLIAGKWHYVLAVFDSITGNHFLLVDGVQQINNVSEVAFTDDDPDNIQIGATSTFSNLFRGQMTEAITYNTAPTLAQGLQLFNPHFKGMGDQILPSNRIVDLRMNDFADGDVASGANTIKDKTGNGNHGTPINNPVGRGEETLSYDHDATEEIIPDPVVAPGFIPYPRLSGMDGGISENYQGGIAT